MGQCLMSCLCPAGNRKPSIFVYHVFVVWGFPDFLNCILAECVALADLVIVLMVSAVIVLMLPSAVIDNAGVCTLIATSMFIVR